MCAFGRLFCRAQDERLRLAKYKQPVRERLINGYERAYSPKWAAAQYRERFVEWPPFAWNNHALVEPQATTRRWIKSRQVAYAKRKVAAV